MPTRREKIEAMLVDEPRDVFLQYSLALELAKEDLHEDSLAKLGELMESAPPYVPAFFMAGKQYFELGRIEKARDVLRAGIEAARRQGDSHAAGEMSEFLASLGEMSD